jgi:hypothetical protein
MCTCFTNFPWVLYLSYIEKGEVTIMKKCVIRTGIVLLCMVSQIAFSATSDDYFPPMREPYGDISRMKEILLRE